jgi:hypothetical protein
MSDAKQAGSLLVTSWKDGASQRPLLIKEPIRVMQDKQGKLTAKLHKTAFLRDSLSRS